MEKQRKNMGLIEAKISFLIVTNKIGLNFKENTG